jgi:hypothetical protein
MHKQLHTNPTKHTKPRRMALGHASKKLKIFQEENLGKKGGRAATERNVKMSGASKSNFTGMSRGLGRRQNRKTERRRNFNGDRSELANETVVGNLRAGGFSGGLAAGVGNGWLSGRGHGMAVGILRDETHQQQDDHQAGCRTSF